MARTLTHPEEIREWAEARGGNPMMMDMPDGTGDVDELLQITFGQHALNADGNEGPDRPGGYQLVSWDDWFATFDGRDLEFVYEESTTDGEPSNFFRLINTD